MKILITGGGGFYGEFLNRILAENNEILTLYHKNIGNTNFYNSIQTDITNYKNLDNLYYEFKPKIVVHAAAIAEPILCNKLKSKFVYDVNVNATKHIAELCDLNNAKLIYISTDLVYAGYRGSMLDENSKLIPASLYAETKLMGEEKIKETFNNYIILRQALLYGLSKINKNNYFQFTFESLKKGNEVKVFTDQYRTPISVFESARVINKIISKEIKKETINLGGTERVNRAEFGELLCEITGFDKSLLRKIKMDDIPDYAGVKDVSLNTNKLKTLGINIMGLEELTSEVVQNYISDD